MKSSLFPRLADRRVLIALAVVTVLVIAGGAAWALMRSGPDRTIAAADYTTLRPKDVESRIPVTATVDTRHVVASSTHLSGAVETVHVPVGDRVQEGQVLAEIDVSGLQKEIDTQLSQQITSDAANLSHREHGMTILFITHNPELAEETGRNITMKDGLIA